MGNRRDPDLVVIPQGLSKGVIRSQLVDRFSTKGMRPVYVLRHGADYSCGEVANAVKISQLRAAMITGKVVYTRSIFDWFVMRMLRTAWRSSTSIIFDVRGLVEAEMALKGRPRWRRALVKILFTLAVRHSTEVWTVSRRMASVLEAEYGRRVSHISPCCVPASRVVRRENSWPRSGPIRLVYVGSMAPWQCFKEVCGIVAGLGDGVALTVVTQNIAAAAELATSMGIEAEFVAGGWDVVQAALDQADFGFLMRQAGVVNETASPVKFAEYLARGVIPVLSEFVGDYSTDFRDESVVISDEQPLSLARLGEALLNRCPDRLYAAALSLTWERVECGGS